MAKPVMRMLGALSLLLAHQSHAAPVRDAHLAVLAHRLFPTLSTAAVPVAPAVSDMLAQRRARMAACNHAPRCLFVAADWTEAERTALVDSAPVSQRAQILRELVGLNHILAVYGLGQAPRYPEIDGPDTKPGTEPFDQYTTQVAALSDACRDDPLDTLDPSLGLALILLDVANRDTAVHFEPLDRTVNAAALARAHTLDWARYAYTAIIVPGVGPEDPVTTLSATGKINVRMAAARYFDGIAPFIVVTGGTVHPRGTGYSEAIEMRRALIDRYGVPADAIVAEPYARHTTTNLRNATRTLVALGAPVDRDALIVTYPAQSRYIESPLFAQRNRTELGYQPGTVGARLSPSELKFRPDLASLRIDPMDPLDP